MQYTPKKRCSACHTALRTIQDKAKTVVGRWAKDVMPEVPALQQKKSKFPLWPCLHSV